VGEYFASTSTWPKISDLQRRCFQAGDRTDIFAIAWALPHALGRVNEHDEVVLTLRGLSFCPSAQALVDGAIRVVQLAVERFRGPEEKLQITSADLTEHLGMDPSTATRVGVLVLNESVLFLGGMNDPSGSWQRNISPGIIVKFADVNTIQDYLNAQADLFWRPSPIPVTSNLHLLLAETLGVQVQPDSRIYIQNIDVSEPFAM
jgi:hypothetical protein